MKNIVYLDEFPMKGAILDDIRSLGNYTGYARTPVNEVVKRAKEAEIIIVNKVIISDEIMAQLPNLRLICVAATGMNNIDLEAAKRRGISVRNAKGYSTHAVAETTLGCALGLMREILYYDEYVKNGSYCQAGHPFGYSRPTRELYGSNWGIIGLGDIGREVARIASAFGCDVAYHSTSGVKREEKYKEKTLNELLEWADVVSVHCPLNDKTRGLIGAAQFALMKKSAIIINVARGGIIDERALVDAINEGNIAGAGVDVFSVEPPEKDNPIFDVKDKYRLLLSPHNAWSAANALQNLVKCVEDNIRNYIDGKGHES